MPRPCSTGSNATAWTSFSLKRAGCRSPLEEFVRRLKNTTAQPSVFVLHPDASPELILEALRAGANEYLYPPLAETLKDALERLAGNRSRTGVGGPAGLGKAFGFYPPAAVAAPPRSPSTSPPNWRGRSNNRCSWRISISKPDCCASS